jgi:hypothetical protein
VGNLWDREPTVLLGVIQAGVTLGVCFGLELTQEQIGAILTFSTAVVTLITRSRVSPTQN